MNRWHIIALNVATLALSTGCLYAGEMPRVLELRTQKVDEITYFHVRLERPANLHLPTFDTSKPFSERDRRLFARLPRLIPQNDKTRAVYYRLRPSQPGLSFCGQVKDGGKAPLLLLYPLAETEPQKTLSLAELVRAPGMAEVAVELDFDKAQAVPVPRLNPEDQHVHRDDLRSYWALHQAAHFAVLETQVVDFNFYSFAREATGRKYNVTSPAWVRRQTDSPEHRLYEFTTGADAVAETLQLHRLMQPEAQPKGKRTWHYGAVQGITVPPQPWDRMLKDKKPKVESLARLIPYDNYYVYFKSIRKFLDFGDLLDQWGTSVLRVYEMKSRDAQLRQRYEKQLCLKSAALVKLLGPAVVKGLAVTGSDPFLREGSDLTIVFEVANPALFRGAVEGFLKEARKEQGSRLREASEKYHGTTIESFVTPLREVSLHRTTLGPFVIYSNSPVAVRRVIDAQQKGGKCLADANDFKYMRTIFPLAEDKEDGFVFLSDAFIRELVGPASRIKEKRRLEALTSLYMVTNAALFCAWETGKLPADLPSALAGAGLRRDDVAIPEVSEDQDRSSDADKNDRKERSLRWGAERQVAVSDAYNTIHFATPLIELPIKWITPAEAQEYTRFRENYAKLWQSYFDPMGIRLSLDAQRVRVETHILPLVGSEQYRTVRDLASQGSLQFAPRTASVVDFRLAFGDLLGPDGVALGYQVDSDALLREIVELLIRWEADPRLSLRREYDRLFWKLPLGVNVRWQVILKDGVEGVVELLKQTGLATNEPKKSRYQNVVIHRLPISAEKYREFARVVDALNDSPFAAIAAVLPRQEAPVALYLVLIDKTLYVSANEAFLKKRIDEARARKESEEKKPAEAESGGAAGLYIAPANAEEAASLFLEYEGHTLALLNNEVWNCFYQTGLLRAQADERAVKAAALRLLGYVPASPDGTPYRYDVRRNEVVNGRHGSLRRPELHRQLAESSELGQFLKQIKALRAEARFLENGLHTRLTIERK